MRHHAVVTIELSMRNVDPAYYTGLRFPWYGMDSVAIEKYIRLLMYFISFNIIKASNSGEFIFLFCDIKICNTYCFFPDNLEI